MLLLGITGGWGTVYEKRYDMHFAMRHDAAAALIDDGEIVAAIEEERLNRIKHTNKAPISAIKHCLDSYGVGLNDVARIAIHGSEDYMNIQFRNKFLQRPRREVYVDARSLHQQMFKEYLGYDVDKSKFYFVHHHIAHAITAMAPSGFERSLVLTIDAYGDGVSGLVLDAERDSVKILESLPETKSLGRFYLNVIRFLGYDLFDEYKVMGLAPYGDPQRYRSQFKELYGLLPDGDYVIHMDNLHNLFRLTLPRVAGEPISQVHKDVAASLQESLEEIVFHVLRHYQRKTGHRNLCLAGGVAHNCTLNGNILYSGLFDNVFVQPASHDAGGAIGAALYSYYQDHSGARPSRLKCVYWGPEVGDDNAIYQALSLWRDFIDIEKTDDIAGRTARLIADGQVIGWVQGRSEFGPRALGNRSILADPRPAENKDIINQMVKKREEYRPFAPSVMEEYSDQYFIVPPGEKKFPFMVFVLKVRQEAQSLLRAVTHVDGTARVQTVSRETNQRFWNLINAFREITGIPVLLNTSFNNNVEPIVDSVEDSVTCFLTTQINYLVIGDYLISKKPVSHIHYLNLIPRLASYSRLEWTKRFSSEFGEVVSYEVGNSYDDRYKVQVSSQSFKLLESIDGCRRLGDLCEELCVDDDQRIALIEELINLWSQRLVLFSPRQI
jgi:carbamoyltransferase